MPFNWFDVLVVAVLIAGILVGRKRGMSQELIGVLMWLSIAIGCAFLYEPLGTMIAQGSVFSQLSAYCMAYLGIGLLIATVFMLLKRAVGEKLVGSDAFGGSEFYLGMLGGMVRFACILITVLALLNARSYTQAEVKAELNYQNDVYGSNFFPTLYTVQAQVFEQSLIGPLIRQNLSMMLIKPTSPEKKQLKRKEIAYP